MIGLFDHLVVIAPAERGLALQREPAHRLLGGVEGAGSVPVKVNVRAWQRTSVVKSASAVPAVAEKMSALMTEEYLEARAKRASRRKFVAVLAKIPDVEPDESDRAPESPRRTRRKKAG